jgi:hypothetical protein
MQLLDGQRALVAINEVARTFHMGDQALRTSVCWICVIHLPTACRIVAGVINHDRPVVGGVTQVRVEDWSITFHDRGHVIDRSHTKRVIACANLPLAVVGGAVGEDPGDAEQQRKEHQPTDNRSYCASQR